MKGAVRSFDDKTLLTRTRELVRQEREITTEILHLLREVERRRLFSAEGYTSLFDFCVRSLGYSEASAQRRIASMRLMKELPELEEKLRDGALSLSVVAQAQSFFRNEEKEAPLSCAQKREVLTALEGCSTRQAERELATRATQPISVSERTRPISDTKTEVRLILDEATIQNLEKLKGILAHSHPGMTLSELVGYLAKTSIEHLDPAREPKRKASFPAREVDRQTGPRPAISRPLKRAVYQKYNGRCSQCGSQHALELDHIHAVALGGPTTVQNLRLLCRSCNQRHAIETYGLAKMETHLARSALPAPEVPSAKG